MGGGLGGRRRRPYYRSSRPDNITGGEGKGRYFVDACRDRDGRLRNVLVTLPFHNSTHAVLEPTGAELSVMPSWKTKALAASALTQWAAGITEPTGRLVISGNVSVGLGFGSSTSDVVAAIRATADALRLPLKPEDIATLAVKVERASDPLMFSDVPMLFAQREGVVVERFERSLPPLLILGVRTLTDPVLTDSLPLPDYSWQEIQQFRVIIAAVRRAIAAGSVALLAKAATRSAEINQRYLPLSVWPDLYRTAAECGAQGLQIAHSGSIAGLIFDARSARLDDSIHLAEEQLGRQGMQFWRFRCGEWLTSTDQ
ncbi:GHMP kinase [Parafrankia sp. Ea1.12]|nr:GHMP kinase [Parafrankia sp. Ea1.12]